MPRHRARDSRGRFVSTNPAFVPVTVEDVRETVREVYGGNPDARFTWTYYLPTPDCPTPARYELWYDSARGGRRVQRSANGRFTLQRSTYHRQTPQWRAEIERNYVVGLDARGRYTITVRSPAEVRDRATLPSSTPPPVHVLLYVGPDGEVLELRSASGTFTLSSTTWWRQTDEWREDVFRRYSVVETMTGQYVVTILNADTLPRYVTVDDSAPTPPPNTYGPADIQARQARITQAPSGTLPRIEIASDRRMMVALPTGEAVWFAPYDNTPLPGRQVYRLTEALWVQLGVEVQNLLIQHFELYYTIDGDLELRQRETPLPTPRPTLPMPLASFESLTTAERDSLRREYGPLTCHLRPNGEGGEVPWVEANETPTPELPVTLEYWHTLTQAQRTRILDRVGPVYVHTDERGVDWVCVQLFGIRETMARQLEEARRAALDEEAAAAFNTARVRWVPETPDAAAYQNPNLQARMYDYVSRNLNIFEYGQEIHFSASSEWYMRMGSERKNWLDPYQWVCPVQKAFPFWDFSGEAVCEIKYDDEDPLLKRPTPLQKYRAKLDKNVEALRTARRIQHERRRQIEERRQRSERRAAGRNGTRRRGRRLRTPAPPPGSVAPHDEEFISTATINA